MSRARRRKRRPEPETGGVPIRDEPITASERVDPRVWLLPDAPAATGHADADAMLAWAESHAPGAIRSDEQVYRERASQARSRGLHEASRDTRQRGLPAPCLGDFLNDASPPNAAS